MSDDLKKEVLRQIIPPAFIQRVKDVIMFREMSEDTLSAAQMKTIIIERIAGMCRTR